MTTQSRKYDIAGLYQVNNHDDNQLRLQPTPGRYLHVVNIILQHLLEIAIELKIIKYNNSICVFKTIGPHK